MGYRSVRVFSAGPLRVEIFRLFPDRRLRATRTLRYREHPNDLTFPQFSQDHFSPVLEHKHIALPPIVHPEDGLDLHWQAEPSLGIFRNIEQLDFSSGSQTDSSRGIFVRNEPVGPV